MLILNFSENQLEYEDLVSTHALLISYRHEDYGLVIYIGRLTNVVRTVVWFSFINQIIKIHKMPKLSVS
jgi:hypothetical protein